MINSYQGRHLVSKHGFDLVAGHALQQARTHRDQRRIASRARGEGVHVRRRIDGDLGRLDAGLAGLSLHDVEEPGLDLVARLRDDLRACRALGHPLGHREGNKRAAEADDERQHQQGLEIDARARLVEDAVDAQQPQHDAENENDGQVGGQEQGNTFEHVCLSPRQLDCVQLRHPICALVSFFQGRRVSSFCRNRVNARNPELCASPGGV